MLYWNELFDVDFELFRNGSQMLMLGIGIIGHSFDNPLPSGASFAEGFYMTKKLYMHIKNPINETYKSQKPNIFRCHHTYSLNI